MDGVRVSCRALALNPKTEGRNSKEGRRPKPEGRQQASPGVFLRGWCLDHRSDRRQCVSFKAIVDVEE